MHTPDITIHSQACCLTLSSLPRPTGSFPDILCMFSHSHMCETLFFLNLKHTFHKTAHLQLISLILIIFSRKWIQYRVCTKTAAWHSAEKPALWVILPHASHSSVRVLENWTDSVKPFVFLRCSSPARFSCCLWIGFYELWKPFEWIMQVLACKEMFLTESENVPFAGAPWPLFHQKVCSVLVCIVYS